MATTKELLNPKRYKSVQLNVRVHQEVDIMLRKMYAKYHNGMMGYNYTDIMSMAILHFNKTLKEKKVKSNDDIKKKLEL